MDARKAAIGLSAGLGLMFTQIAAEEENLPQNPCEGLPEKHTKAAGEQCYMSLKKKNITRLKTDTPEILPDGQARFTVDITNFGPLNWLFTQQLALAPEKLKREERWCPYISLEERKYSVSAAYQDNGKKFVIIKTALTDAEYEAASEAGCVITSKPDGEKLRHLM